MNKRFSVSAWWLLPAAMVAGLAQLYPSMLAQTAWVSLALMLVFYYALAAALRLPRNRYDAVTQQIASVAEASVYYLCETHPLPATVQVLKNWESGSARLSCLRVIKFGELFLGFFRTALSIFSWGSAIAGCMLTVGYLAEFEHQLIDEVTSLLHWAVICTALMLNFFFGYVAREGIVAESFRLLAEMRNALQQLEQFTHLHQVVKDESITSTQFPRVLTAYNFDPITARRERKYRAVEVLRCLLQKKQRVHVGLLRALLMKVRLHPQLFAAVGGEEMLRLIQQDRDELIIGLPDPERGRWHLGGTHALHSSELQPVIWG